MVDFSLLGVLYSLFINSPLGVISLLSLTQVNFSVKQKYSIPIVCVSCVFPLCFTYDILYKLVIELYIVLKISLIF